MKKMVFRLLLLALFSVTALAQNEIIGEEVIKPIEYPKVILMGSFSGLRYGGLNSTTHTALDSHQGGGFGIDVGLYKYFNAGVLFSFSLGNFYKYPLAINNRMTLFARPQITFYDRLCVFTRLGGGLSFLIGTPVKTLQALGSEQSRNEINTNYRYLDYSLISPGFNGVATIGIEYFPWNRFGLSLEWGIVADYLFITRSPLLKELNMAVNPDYQGIESAGYFSYELPVFLSLNIIF